MLTALAIYTPEEFQEAIKDKKPIKIRIALFYDGTMNHRKNIEEREANSDIYHKMRVKDGPNSYDNGRTNIAIMEPHVSKEKADYAGDYDLVYKHYIAGQGPIKHKKDSVWGYALAIGESGVPRRAEEGIDYAVNSILKEDDKIINPLDHYIEKLTIDVFGFSRGAATARYAIHVILNGKLSSFDDDTGHVSYDFDPVVNRLSDFYVVKNNAVEVGFAGLYDTVLSYIGSQLLPWTSNTLQQTAVSRAKKALHLAAADEHRSDFSLHKIKSAVDSGIGEEYYLPGVHSDIGGSYNKANEITLKNETDESKKQYMLTSNEGMPDACRSMIDALAYTGLVLHEGGEYDRATLDQDRADLIAQGWYKPDEINVVVSSWTEGQPSGYELRVKRHGIRSAYCNIPLKIMAEYARKPDVKLKISAELEDRTNKILESEPDLQKLEGIIRDYMASHKTNSRPGHWIDDNAPLNNAALKQIRNKHFHFSSKPGIGYSPRFEWDDAARKFRRKRYYYNA